MANIDLVRQGWQFSPHAWQQRHSHRKQRARALRTSWSQREVSGSLDRRPDVVKGRGWKKESKTDSEQRTEERRHQGYKPPFQKVIYWSGGGGAMKGCRDAGNRLGFARGFHHLPRRLAVSFRHDVTRDDHASRRHTRTSWLVATLAC